MIARMILLGMALTLALSAGVLPTAAMAGVKTADSGGSFENQATACSSAKRRAQDTASRYGKVNEVGQCSCARDPSDHPISPGQWRCTVDAYYSER